MKIVIKSCTKIMLLHANPIKKQTVNNDKGDAHNIFLKKMIMWYPDFPVILRIFTVAYSQIICHILKLFLEAMFPLAQPLICFTCYSFFLFLQQKHTFAKSLVKAFPCWTLWTKEFLLCTAYLQKWFEAMFDHAGHCNVYQNLETFLTKICSPLEAVTALPMTALTVAHQVLPVSVGPGCWMRLPDEIFPSHRKQNTQILRWTKWNMKDIALIILAAVP